MNGLYETNHIDFPDSTLFAKNEQLTRIKCGNDFRIETRRAFIYILETCNNYQRFLRF